jgi:hypothetical protein
MRSLPLLLAAIAIAGAGSITDLPAQVLPAPTAQDQAAATANEDGEDGEECTVGVASGRATADGRPLLWKNRDAQKRHNVVTAFADGKHPYVAICDAGTKTSVWGGANAAGFCIINSVSRDLPQGSTKGPGNGSFMKRALMQCETVEDFEALLTATAATGRRTRANFGVIDARGGAAFFETSHLTHRRFDAAKAERGLLVRSNFATTANGDRGRDRFARAEALCRSVPKANKLDHGFLLQQFCRDLQAPPTATPGEAGQQDVRETIHRQTTVAAMVFHGCKQDEDPRWTTMWAILGQPLFSLAVPCFPAAGAVATELAGDPRSELCNTSLRLQDAFYALPAPATDGGEAGSEAEVSGATRWLLLEHLPALQRVLLPAERDALAATAAQLAAWQQARPAPSIEVQLEFHRAQAKAALTALQALAATYVPVGAGR